MKCKFCDGSGKDYWCLNGEPYPCPVCNGTGEYEPFDADVELDKLYPTEQTEQEYIQTCNTEQLAEVFMRFMFDADFKTRFVNGNFIKEFREWLKQPHTEKE